MDTIEYAQGAFPGPTSTIFRIWAPRADSLELHIGNLKLPLSKRPDGYFEREVDIGTAPAGANYQMVFPDGRRRADPATRLQEGSVHRESTVFDTAFDWTDGGWKGIALQDLVFYELHVGTFTPRGDLDSAIAHLDELKDLGITAVELMPLAPFDGDRGWGYDGALIYSVHAAYGGPRALQRFVNAAHSKGLAVFLDVVYNHFGPAGNYLREFGPYFTSRHQTPWGDAIDFDGPSSQPVRRYFVQNALYWIRDFHMDGLRLDAIHGIVDDSPIHIVDEINSAVEDLGKRSGRAVQVIAESDLNDPRVVRDKSDGGWGVAAQWSDDFHHSLHTLVTGERPGYYADFGEIEQMAKAYRETFVLDGGYSRFRGKPYGKSARGIPGFRFVVASQNHDQVGNRAIGDRLAQTLKPEALRLAAAATILSPFLPLIFMGEEYAEPAPFQYFTSFPDLDLGRAVSEGRLKEFEKFGWKGQVPDPQLPSTFERSKIDFGLRHVGWHAAICAVYRELLKLRRELVSIGLLYSQCRTEFDNQSRVLLVSRSAGINDSLLVLHFSRDNSRCRLPTGSWRIAFDSWSSRWAADNEWEMKTRDDVNSSLDLGPWHSALLIGQKD